MAYGVITLGREICSGGCDIGKEVARELNLPYYDKELITIAAKKSGLSEEAIAASEKRRTSSLMYSLYTMGNQLPLADQVFILQSKIIKELAEEGPCVIVGRCADYVLRDMPGVLRTFIYAPMSYRIAWGRQNQNLPASDSEAENAIRRADRRKADYYNYYTQNRWGEAANYDLCLNAAIGRDNCAHILRFAYQAMMAEERYQ